MAPSLKSSSGILAIGLLLGLAVVLGSCAARAKSPSGNPSAAKPAATRPAAASTQAPSAPLSSTQTQVELPKPQPIDPAALATESAPPPPVETPAAPRPPVAQTPRKNPPRTDTTPPAVAAPVVPPAAEPERPQVQEIVSAADLKRFQDSAQNHRREVTRIVESLKNRRLSKAQQNVVSSIRSFVALSEDAEKRGDMRQADALADRAYILARDLQNGK